MHLPSGGTLIAPTEDEALRVKAFLVVRRNTERDYLDCAALADHLGLEGAARVLVGTDDYYADQIGEGDGVATQVARQFAEPKPKDARVIQELDRYKQLDRRWTDWSEVTSVLGAVSVLMTEEV